MRSDALTANPTYWPQPEVSGETKPFWDACGRGEFLLQRCDGCGKFQYPYRGFCCHCWAGRPKDVASTGRGTVWSYSVVRRNRSRGHGTEPYIVAVVELEEGVRVVSNLMDCPIDEVAIGQPVEVYFQPLDNLSLPLFRPVPAVSD